MAFKDCPTKETHLFQYTSLPLLPDYRDPFDRMLIARAAAGSLPIISADPKSSLYKNLVQVEW
jgi:PIN domain nuclease of toxin-antitoxin system